MEAMRYLLAPLTLWLRFFPQLAACHLVGVLGRTGAVAWAGWAGHDNELWAALIMPLAAMARLGSYVAMFLVLRNGIPVLAAIPRRAARQVDVFATIIVPFFAIYLAWQMFREDWLAYEQAALGYRIADPTSKLELHPDTLPGGTVTLVIIAVALVARYVLGWLKERMPGWMLPVRVYLDALWVFLVLSFSASHGATFLLNPGAWVSQRRIIVWFNTTRESLFSHVHFLQTGWDAVMWALRTVFGGAAVPLLWLAVACIVYGVTAKADWHSTARRLGGDRADDWIDRTKTTRERLGTGWKRVPAKLRANVREHLEGQLGKFKPITDSAHIIAQGGLLALSLYVLAYLGLAWLDMSGSFYGARLGSGYLFRGIAWILGPQDGFFWAGFRETIGLISHTLIEPLRITLVATTVAWCVQRAAAHASPSTAAAESQSVGPRP